MYLLFNLSYKYSNIVQIQENGMTFLIDHSTVFDDTGLWQAK